RVQRLSVVALLSRGIFGNDCGFVDCGNSLVGRMASSLSTSVERKHLGLSVLTTSGSDFPSAGTDGLRGRVSHAQTSIFPGADDWSGRIRHGPGTDWLTFVLAASARPHPGYFLV